MDSIDIFLLLILIRIQRRNRGRRRVQKMGEMKSLLQGLMGYDSSRRLLLLTDDLSIILIWNVSYCLPN